MAEVAKLTTVRDYKDRGNTSSAVPCVQTQHLANTSATLKYVVSPVSGVLKAADVQASITSDATKTYTFIIANVSNSGAVMTAASQVYDADPVLTAGTKASLSLSATAANLAVDKGDLISISMAGGTGSGLTCTALYFEEQ